MTLDVAVAFDKRFSRGVGGLHCLVQASATNPTKLWQLGVRCPHARDRNGVIGFRTRINTSSQGFSRGVQFSQIMEGFNKCYREWKLHCKKATCVK